MKVFMLEGLMIRYLRFDIASLISRALTRRLKLPPSKAFVRGLFVGQFTSKHSA